MPVGLKAPVMPERKDTIMYTVKDGDTYTSLAHRYNSTVPIIQSANNATNDNLKIGQELKIPTHDPEEWAEYLRQDSIYWDTAIRAEDHRLKAKRAADKRENVKATERVIKEFAVSGLEDKYSLWPETDVNGNKTGNIVIVLCNDVHLSEMLDDLGIKEKEVFNNMNKEAIAAIPKSEIMERGEYKLEKAEMGSEFVIQGRLVHPQKTVLQYILDGVNSIVSTIAGWLE